MDDSKNKALLAVGIFIFYVVFGPPIGTYVLVNLVKTDFNDGPLTYYIYGYAFGVIPAFIAAILNLVYVKYLFKLKENPNIWYCIFTGALAGVTVGLSFYILAISILSNGSDKLDFFTFILVFCIPSTVLGVFNKGFYQNTPNKKINKDT